MVHTLPWTHRGARPGSVFFFFFFFVLPGVCDPEKWRGNIFWWGDLGTLFSTAVALSKQMGSAKPEGFLLGV